MLSLWRHLFRDFSKKLKLESVCEAETNGERSPGILVL